MMALSDKTRSWRPCQIRHISCKPKRAKLYVSECMRMCIYLFAGLLHLLQPKLLVQQKTKKQFNGCLARAHVLSPSNLKYWSVKKKLFPWLPGAGARALSLQAFEILLHKNKTFWSMSGEGNRFFAVKIELLGRESGFNRCSVQGKLRLFAWRE